MGRVVLPLVVLLFHCAFVCPQVTKQFFIRKTTTEDPVQAFFSSCDPRNAECVQSQDCSQNDILNEGRCSTFGQVCCKKEDSPIVFPDRTTRRPVIKTTRTTIPTTTTTARTRTKPPKTTTTTTTTTTTEKPIIGWSPADCGVRHSNSSYSVDIRDSERGEFPWNVEIFSKDLNEFGFLQDVFLCGGTLVDDFVVITSANCENLRGSTELFVSVGVWNLEDPEEKRQVRKVERIVKHPRFEYRTRIASIAILILEDQVDFSRHVNRICLPNIDVDFSGSTCFLTGWGGTPDSGPGIRPYMKVVEMNLLKHSDCHAAMQRTLLKYELNENFQCAQEEATNHICPFDVGSPLFCTIPGRHRQFYHVGVFVWNTYLNRNGACYSGNGIVNLFVKVQNFRQWVDDEMGKIHRDINIYIPQPEEEEDDDDR